MWHLFVVSYFYIHKKVIISIIIFIIIFYHYFYHNTLSYSLSFIISYITNFSYNRSSSDSDTIIGTTSPFNKYFVFKVDEDKLNNS